MGHLLIVKAVGWRQKHQRLHFPEVCDIFKMNQDLCLVALKNIIIKAVFWYHILSTLNVFQQWYAQTLLMEVVKNKLQGTKRELYVS